MKARDLVPLALGLVAGVVIAALYWRGDASPPRPRTEVTAGSERTVGDGATTRSGRRMPPARTTVRTRESVDRPVIDLQPQGERDPRWDDDRRDDAWATAMEAAIDATNRARLLEDLEDATWIGTHCGSRTCSMSIEIPTAQAEDLHLYLSVLMMTPDVEIQYEQGEPSADGLTRYDARILFQEERSVEWFRTAQAEMLEHHADALERMRQAIMMARKERGEAP